MPQRGVLKALKKISACSKRFKSNDNKIKPNLVLTTSIGGGVHAGKKTFSKHFVYNLLLSS